LYTGASGCHRFTLLLFYNQNSTSTKNWDFIDKWIKLMMNLDLAQMEQLKQIGEHLCRERQARSIPLEEVALKTYIPLRLLQALELGQLERLPEPVFVQGFIRRYADILGLDGTVLANTFITESSVRSIATVKLPELPHQPETDSLQGAIRQVGDRLSHLPRLSLPQLPKISLPRLSLAQLPNISLPILLGGAAVILLGTGAMFLLNQPKQASVPKSSSNSVATDSTQSASPINQANQSAPTIASSPTPEVPVQIVVNATEDAWIRVVADGKPEFEDTLKKGTQKTWTAQKQILVRSGNAGGILISYNNGDAKRLGELGQVKDAAFPPQENSTRQVN
jgi:cytoskeletal protein RodZ